MTVVLHLTSGQDLRRPGGWLVEPWGLQVVAVRGARTGARWQIAMHGCADERMRAWLLRALPAREQRWHRTLREARAVLADALEHCPPAADMQVRLPVLRAQPDGRYLTAEGDFDVVRDDAGRWVLRRAQLHLGADSELPFWVHPARSLYEAALLVRQVREDDARDAAAFLDAA